MCLSVCLSVCLSFCLPLCLSVLSRLHPPTLGVGKSVVNMHCFDDLEKCHLVSKFSCIPQAGSVLVRYEEATSSPKIAVKISQNKIKKAHQYVLTLVAAQVAKVMLRCCW
jgi:hypothetical protein